MELTEIRLQNLRNLQSKIGQKKLASTLTLEQAEVLAEVCRNKSLASPTEEFVRAIEKEFRMAPDTLDCENGSTLTRLFDPLMVTRRENLRALIKEVGGGHILSKRLGYGQSSYLSQMAGPNPSRGITEKTARAYERQLGLDQGHLDRPITDAVAQTASSPTEPSAPTPQMSATDMLKIVLAATAKVGTVCDVEKVELSLKQFSGVLQLVIKDAADHNGTVRDEYIKDVLELLK